MTKANVAAFLRAFFLASALVVFGCGGGGSSSGGGGGGTPAQYAGTYTGTGSATVTGGGASISESIPTTIVIDMDGNVTVDPDDPLTGTLNGNSFVASAPTSDFNEPGFTCSGSLVVSATVTGNTINGTYSSNNFACNGVPFQVSGTFTAAKTTVASLRTPSTPGNSIVNTLREVIRSMR